MNRYEAVVIFKSDISEETYDDIVAYYKTILKDFTHSEFKVNVDKLLKKSLAYPIKREKKEYTDGYYAVYKFYAKPDDITELERLFRIDEHILKFITLKVDDDDTDHYEEEEDSAEDSAEAAVESEQDVPDALDVLLGFAEYKKKEMI